MALAWQVFLGLALFAVVVCLLIVLRRMQVSAWERVRPVLGQSVVMVAVALAAVALAAGVGMAVAWALS